MLLSISTIGVIATALLKVMTLLSSMKVVGVIADGRVVIVVIL